MIDTDNIGFGKMAQDEMSLVFQYKWYGGGNPSEHNARVKMYSTYQKRIDRIFAFIGRMLLFVFFLGAHTNFSFSHDSNWNLAIAVVLSVGLAYTIDGLIELTWVILIGLFRLPKKVFRYFWPNIE